MEQKEILESNILIANFYGYIRSNNEEIDAGEMKQLKYHTSWDSLIPVVEKIQSLGFKFIIGDSNIVTVYNKEYDWRNGSTEDVLIMCAWHGVVEFIKWYNQNKQQ